MKRIRPSRVLLRAAKICEGRSGEFACHAIEEVVKKLCWLHGERGMYTPTLDATMEYFQMFAPPRGYDNRHCDSTNSWFCRCPDTGASSRHITDEEMQTHRVLTLTMAYQIARAEGE